MLKDIVNKKITEYITIVIAFGSFLFTACYKLTASPLWFDESIEYWYSKVLIGQLPNQANLNMYAGTTTNMYQRIILTQQPPLYNFLMHFWLLISDSELWFHLGGVVAGLFAAVAIFMTVKKLSNTYVASASVFFSAFIYQLVYYWQECAEYGLMLCMLSFATYFWVSFLKDRRVKYIVLFTIFACLSVYSQYGAAFPVAAMGIYMLLLVFHSNRELKRPLLLSYVVALIGAALPLYIFFIRLQVNVQSSYSASHASTEYADRNIIVRCIYDTLSQIRWTFFQDNIRNLIIFGCIGLFLILLFVVFAFSQSILASHLIGMNLLCFALYFVATKLGYYGFEGFGNRYGIFLIPLWVVLLADVIYEFILLLKGNFRKLVVCGCLLCLAGYAIYSWHYAIGPHKDKGYDTRELVEEWYKAGGADADTIVFFWMDPLFSYYASENSNYIDLNAENVYYTPWSFGYTYDLYMEQFNEHYNGEWPTTLYAIDYMNFNGCYEFLEVFNQMGYTSDWEYTTEKGDKVVRLNLATDVGAEEVTADESENTEEDEVLSSEEISEEELTGVKAFLLDETNLEEKQALIANSNIYASGDSILAGGGTAGIKLTDFMNQWGATIVNDTSYSGAFLTPVCQQFTGAPTITTKQYDSLKTSIEENGINENSVLIIDGGGNDFTRYFSEIFYKKVATYRPDLVISDISIHGGTDADKDMQKSLDNYLNNLCEITGNKDSSRGYQVPIIFIIPKLDYEVNQSNADSSGGDIIMPDFSDESTSYEEYLKFMKTYEEDWIATLKSTCEKYEDYGVIVIDDNYYFEKEDFADFAHPSYDGYVKMRLAIANVLYNLDTYKTD